VVGIHGVGAFLCESCHRRVRAQIIRLAADDGVLAVRFVPDGVNLQSVLSRGLHCAELCLALMRKAVAHANSVFSDVHEKKGFRSYATANRATKQYGLIFVSPCSAPLALNGLMDEARREFS